VLTEQYIELENKYGANIYNPLDVVIERAEGVWLYDTEGRRYLDCLAAYSAVNQGHCHPSIMKALIDQVRKVTLTSRAFRNAELPLLYRELHDLTGYGMAIPMNSGSEAIETAIKAARKWGYEIKGIPQNQAEIIVCSNNFHGRTVAIVSFSSEKKYRASFGPYLSGFKTIPFGNAALLRETITPHTCAFLVEPIQGEAGIIIPPDGYLKEVAAICRQNRVLLMVDEIQSGLGRTGKLFAYMHDEIVPDVVVVGKALSGGYYPVSAVLSTPEILGIFNPGDHGSTFGGNPLACAVARAALRVLVDEDLTQRSAELGRLFLEELETIQSRKVRCIRGRGLWIAIELRVPARPYCEALKEEGVLCKETHDKVIRIAPPLTITSEEMIWAAKRIRAVIMRMDEVAECVEGAD
jgi:ornithine--oxo-acid transaminase